MTYKCIECGAEFDYEHIVKHRLKCTKCKEKRSNIWVKKKPEGRIKIVFAR